MVEAIIFDAGGVIHADPSKAVRSDIAQTLGISEEKEAEAWQIFHPLHGEGKINEDEFWRGFLEHTNSKAVLPQESLLLREYIKGFEPFNEVLDIVRDLKASGYKVALLSNSIQPHADYNNTVGIYDVFPIRILSHEVGVRKPDAQIYQLALDRLGVEPNNAIFVDDNEPNVDAAKTLGIAAVKFENPDQLKKQLKDMGVYTYA